MDEKYKQLQIDGSDWSYGSKWGDQMQASVEEIFKDVNKSSNILDVGCGEGRGLQTLYNMEFDRKRLIGVDLSPEKLRAARARGLLCLEEDFHTLQSIPSKYFDFVYCSHTLEHAYDLTLAFSSLIRVCKYTVYFIVPIGETLEEVVKYNPSHTSPIQDIFQIEEILKTFKANGSIIEFELKEKNRMCKEVWGEINI